MVRAYRDVLAVPGARALIGASAASQIGNWLYNAALLGYVYSATHSAVWVGAATICKGLPYVLLGPFGGAIADRYRRLSCDNEDSATRVADLPRGICIVNLRPTESPVCPFRLPRSGHS
jgi:hypothetical protein